MTEHRRQRKNERALKAGDLRTENELRSKNVNFTIALFDFYFQE